MGKKLSTLIQQTEAAIGAENDPKKLRNLQAKLATFTATRAEMDGDDGEDGDDGDDGKDGKDGKDGEDGEDGDDAKSKKAAAAAVKAKKAAEAAKHRAKGAAHKQSAAECEEAAKAAEADEEEDEEARLRVTAPTASLSAGAQAALDSQSEFTRDAMARIKKLETEATSRTHSALIADAVATRRVTRHEATTLAKKPLAFVRDFLEMRPKALVNIDEDAMVVPDTKATAADVPANVKALVEQGVRAAGLSGKEADAYRDASYQAHRSALLNGAGVTH